MTSREPLEHTCNDFRIVVVWSFIYWQLNVTGCNLLNISVFSTGAITIERMFWKFEEQDLKIKSEKKKEMFLVHAKIMLNQPFA